MTNDLLHLSDLTPQQIADLIDVAAHLKRHPQPTGVLAGRLAIYYHTSPSTRERITFADAAARLGATIAIVGPGEIARAGPAGGTHLASLAGSYCAVLVASTDEDDLDLLARNATIPVVNARSPRHRPYQALADLLALQDGIGGLDALRLAYIGDPAESRDLLHAGVALGMDIRVTPSTDADHDHALAAARMIAKSTGGRVSLATDPGAAADGANAIYISSTATASLAPTGRVTSCYRLVTELLANASPHALVLHDPPGHPGHCIGPQLVAHPQATLRAQAANRLPCATALLLAATDRLPLATDDRALANAGCA